MLLQCNSRSFFFFVVLYPLWVCGRKRSWGSFCRNVKWLCLDRVCCRCRWVSCLLCVKQWKGTKTTDPGVLLNNEWDTGITTSSKTQSLFSTPLHSCKWECVCGGGGGRWIIQAKSVYRDLISSYSASHCLWTRAKLIVWTGNYLFWIFLREFLSFFLEISYGPFLSKGYSIGHLSVMAPWYTDC